MCCSKGETSEPTSANWDSCSSTACVQAMSLHLLCERKKGADSFWKPYMDMLPDQVRPCPDCTPQAACSMRHAPCCMPLKRPAISSLKCVVKLQLHSTDTPRGRMRALSAGAASTRVGRRAGRVAARLADGGSPRRAA